MKLNSHELSQLILQEPRAVTRFYLTIRPKLERYFGTRVENHPDRDELVQDTILSILDSLPRYRGEAAFFTWVLSIAHHELVDYYRRKKIKTLLFSKLPFLERIVDKALGPQLRLEEIELKQKIAHTLENLGEGYAAVLRLRYIEGHSVAEIASRLGLSYKACESRLSRARLAFRLEFVQNRSVVPTGF